MYDFIFLCRPRLQWHQVCEVNALPCECCRTKALKWFSFLLQIKKKTTLLSFYIFPVSEHLQCRKPIIRSKNIHSYALRVRIKNVLVVAINNFHVNFKKLGKVQSCVCMCLHMGFWHSVFFSDLMVKKKLNKLI